MIRELLLFMISIALGLLVFISMFIAKLCGAAFAWPTLLISLIPAFIFIALYIISSVISFYEDD